MGVETACCLKDPWGDAKVIPPGFNLAVGYRVAAPMGDLMRGNGIGFFE